MLITGEYFVIYAAISLNCPLLRVMNKYMDKPILKARYLMSNEEAGECWEDLNLDALNESDQEIANDFSALVEKEQERFLEYLEPSPNSKSTVEILIEREYEFTKKIEKLAGISQRKVRWAATPPQPSMSPHLKRCYSNCANNAQLDAKNSPFPRIVRSKSDGSMSSHETLYRSSSTGSVASSLSERLSII